MTNFETLISEVINLTAQKAKYDANPTKAESRRMRNTINTIKSLCTPAKNDLMAADAAMPTKPKAAKA